MADPVIPQYIVLKDFRNAELTGTTASVGDTQALFRNPVTAMPIFWIVLEGDVYIPRRGISASNVDVRARLASTDFRILFFY